MKKFLKITAAIVILLLICYFGFFKLRQIRASNISIPASANAVLKINVDGLYKTLALSYVKHPDQYSGLDKKGIKEKIDGLNTGLKIPANIYIYTLKGKAKTTLFSSFEIADTSAFNQFISKNDFLKLTKIDAGFFESKDSTLCILFNKTTVALAFSPGKEKVKSALKEILNQKNTVKIGDSKFNDLVGLSDHVSFQNAENLSKINFTDGKINFSNEFINKLIDPAPQPQHRVLNTESTICMWLNGKFKTDLTKKNQTANPSFLSKYNFLRFYKDYVDFEWANTIKQADTVIGYEYNEDFERVEKKIIQEKKIPSISINMSANNRELSNYLKSSNALDQSTGKISRTIFPLYQLHFKSNDGNIQFSTLQNAKFDLKRESSDDFFYLKVDFNKLTQQVPMPIIANNLKAFSKLEVRAKSIGKDQIKLESELLFSNKEINSLIELVKISRGGLNGSLNLSSSLDISIKR